MTDRDASWRGESPLNRLWRSRATQLAVLALAVACGPSETGDGPDPNPAEEARRPNVVLIIIDTLRADVLSSYGHSADPSPALSRLTADGVQFDSVISQTSWTLPSIGSMLTSQYPRTLGLYAEFDHALPERFVALAEVLNDHGYATFGATANPNINSRAQFDQGFDEYVDSIYVFRRSRDDVEEGEVFARDAKLHSARELLKQAADFAAATDPSTPVYLQLNLMEVHEYTDLDMLRPAYRELFPGVKGAPYLRMVRQVTDDIEVFVNKLRAQPGWEDTLFCITSDHGEGLSDHPAVSNSRGHGGLLYPSMVHVPWVLFNSSWTPAVRRVTQTVRLLELVPTLLGLVGIASPSDLAGVSLVPLLEGAVAVAPLPEYLVTETYFRDFRKISAIGPSWQYLNNRTSAQGLPEHELQARSETPNGAETDQAADHPDVLELMQRFVSAWESQHEEAAPVPVETALTDELREQLNAIGYTR